MRAEEWFVLQSNPSTRRVGGCGIMVWLAAWSVMAQAQPPEQIKEAPIVPFANVLENGDFETLDNGQQPSGWLPVGATSPQASAAGAAPVEFVKAANGNHYVLLKPVGAPATRRIMRKLMVSPKWKTLKVTARVMGKNLEGGPKQYEDAHIGLVFFDALEREVGYAIPLTLPTDADWTTLSGMAEVPAAADHVVLDAANFGVAGEFAVDDIKVEPNAPIAAPLLSEEFPEGSFEETAADGQPLGWPVKGRQHIAVCEVNGQHFLRLTNSALDQSVEMPTIWKLAPNVRRVRIQALMRGIGIQPGPQPWETARLGVVFADVRGARLGDWPPVLELKADTNWKVFSETLTVPPGTVFLRLNPALLNTRGTFDIDEIQIEQLQ